MSDQPWREAIIRVLTERKTPLHYAEIANVIAEQKLRTELNANPATSVNSTISQSFRDEGDESPFVRVGRGVYGLRGEISSPSSVEVENQEEQRDDTGLINAFGMYWTRSGVFWSPTPMIFGQQQPGSTAVDFCGQRGVYLLHDGRAVVYVGRTTDQPLGVRLRQHTVDRLNGRWDRFSWFGVYPVTVAGSLDQAQPETFGLEMLIVTMEALLIEGLEPPQNRKRGDEFKAIEFLQVPDPEFEKRQKASLLDEMKAQLR
jgi:hypothetical protein